MRVHLQDTASRLYYTGQNCPLGVAERAMIFGSVGSAAKLALEERLSGMQIVVRYDLVACEIGLPILAEWCSFNLISDRAFHLHENQGPALFQVDKWGTEQKLN